MFCDASLKFLTVDGHFVLYMQNPKLLSITSEVGSIGLCTCPNLLYANAPLLHDTDLQPLRDMTTTYTETSPSNCFISNDTPRR